MRMRRECALAIGATQRVRFDSTQSPAHTTCRNGLFVIGLPCVVPKMF